MIIDIQKATLFVIIWYRTRVTSFCSYSSQQILAGCEAGCVQTKAIWEVHVPAKDSRASEFWLAVAIQESESEMLYFLYLLTLLENPKLLFLSEIFGLKIKIPCGPNACRLPVFNLCYKPVWLHCFACLINRWGSPSPWTMSYQLWFPQSLQLCLAHCRGTNSSY